MSLSVQANQSYSVSTVTTGEARTAASSVSGTAALLPTPSGDPQTDAMSWLYLVISKQQSLDVSDGKATLATTQKLRDEAYKAEVKAIKEAVEAAQHSSFWGSIASIAIDVGKVAAVVGSIAVAVGTGGAGIVAVLAVAGAVLSTAGFAESELHVLEKLGVDEGTASWIGVGLSVAGAACSGGAGLAGSAGTAAGEVSTVQKVATTAGKMTSVAGGVTTAAGGAAKIEAGLYAGDQQDALADAAKAQLDQQRLMRLIFMMLDDLKASQDSDNNTLGAIRGSLNVKGETLVASTTMRA